MKFIKAVYSGNLLGLSVLAYIFLGGGLAGSVMFSFCIFMTAILKLPSFVSQVSRVMVKEETILGLVIILLGNIMGLLVDLMLIMPASWFAELQLMAMSVITVEGLNGSLLSHLTLGIIGGGIVEVGHATYRRLNHPFTVMMPISIMALTRAQHGMANLFALMITNQWYPIIWLVTLIGNVIGALTLSICNFDKFGHSAAHKDHYDSKGNLPGNIYQQGQD